MTDHEEALVKALRVARDNCHHEMKKKGFWGEGTKTPMGLVAKLALIGCEVAEVIECVRKDPTAPSTKVPEISCEAEECADILLRLLDYCGARGIDLGEAAAKKYHYNLTRPFKHGKSV